MKDVTEDLVGTVVGTLRLEGTTYPDVLQTVDYARYAIGSRTRFEIKVWDCVGSSEPVMRSRRATDNFRQDAHADQWVVSQIKKWLRGGYKITLFEGRIGPFSSSSSPAKEPS